MSDFKEERKEQLYRMLFDVLQELTEYDDSDSIFDAIVDDFAASAEYHMGQVETFNSMLNTFRHSNPVDTIPDEVPEADPYQRPRRPDWDKILGDLDDISKTYMSSDPNKLSEVFSHINFPPDK